MFNQTTKRLLLVLAILVAFLPFPFFLETENLFTLLDAVAVTLGVAVIFSYLRGSLDWIWHRPSTTAGHLLVFGIVATWIATTGRLTWLWIWRLTGRPHEFFDHWFVAMTIYLFIVGGALHLAANRAIEDRVPLSGWVTLLVAVAFGLLIGLGLIYMTG